ncbi:TMEM175 family protein [Spirosoma gilvum]
MKELKHNNKKEFQLQRLFFFNDAIFAIMLTCAMLDLKSDLLVELSSDQKMISSFIKELPKWENNLINFCIIGSYWVLHHKIFGYVWTFSQSLIWLNGFLLMAILILPVSGSLYGQVGNPNLLVPIAIYTLNLVFISLFSYLLWRLISNPKNNLSLNADTQTLKNRITAYIWVIPCAFLTSLVVIIILPIDWRWVWHIAPILVLLYYYLINIIFKTSLTNYKEYGFFYD